MDTPRPPPGAIGGDFTRGGIIGGLTPARPPPGAIGGGGGDFTEGGMGIGFERGMFLPEDGGFLTLAITCFLS
jgi:hypothetical protein